jgi:uncharacterized DUF497 family protein
MRNEQSEIMSEVIRWSDEKNEKLVSERSISFEEIERAMRE